MSEGLKPCPFCGGKAVFRKANACSIYWIKCEKCGVTGDASTRKVDAFNNWNQRFITEDRRYFGRLDISVYPTPLYIIQKHKWRRGENHDKYNTAREIALIISQYTFDNLVLKAMEMYMQAGENGVLYIVCKDFSSARYWKWELPHIKNVIDKKYCYPREYDIKVVTEEEKAEDIMKKLFDTEVIDG